MGTENIDIGLNGNWHIDGVDTGNPAQGPQGIQGVRGDKGITGDKGATGATGATIPLWVTVSGSTLNFTANTTGAARVVRVAVCATDGEVKWITITQAA